jgi:hypothetical protein
VSNEWWTGIPAAQATLTCGDARHRLVWKDGLLTTPDHADPDGERALSALGGESLACIEMLDAWRRHSEDPAVLLLSSRGPGDLIPPPQELQHLRRMVRRGSPGASDPENEEPLARLLSLGGGLSRRLDATVAAHWRDRLHEPDAEADRLQTQLHAALYGRVLATLGGWLGQREPPLTLELVPETTSPVLQRDADGGDITAALPFSWLVDVWARGLDVVWGRFCLSAATANGREWELLTVGPDLDTPTVLKITQSG